jgi:hypothetical protein
VRIAAFLSKHPRVSTVLVCAVIILGLVIYDRVILNSSVVEYNGSPTGHVIQSTWFTPGQGRGWDGESEPGYFEVVLEDGSKWRLGESLLQWGKGDRIELGQNDRGYFIKDLDRLDEVGNPDTSQAAGFMGMGYE